MKRLEKSCTVNNVRGIHGRVATRLAEIAISHDVILEIEHCGETVDCSSILDVLSLALVCGTEVKLRTKGNEARQAMIDAENVLISSTDP